MKVILLEEVAGRGHEGDVVDVARGFAVNYLLPRKLAIEATAGNLKQLESRRANIEKREATRRADAESVKALIDGKAITIEAKAGEEGRLFGSVTSMMIQDELLEQLAATVDRKKMEVGAHIKEIGEHEVAVRISHDVRATVTVRVVPEGGELEERVSVMDDAEKAVSQILTAMGEEGEEGEAEEADDAAGGIVEESHLRDAGDPVIDAESDDAAEAADVGEADEAADDTSEADEAEETDADEE